MSEPSSSIPPSTSVTRDGIVATDAPCRHCGYNLRGLKVRGQCPECDKPVRMSIGFDHLAGGDPEWLDRMATGAQIVNAAGIGCVVSAMLVTFLGSFAQLLLMVSGVGLLVGIWMLTLPDPSGIGEPKASRVRLIARTLLFAGACVLPIAWARDYFFAWGPLMLARWSQMLVNLLLFAGGGGFVVLFHHLRLLGERLHNRGLSEFMTVQSWVLAICLTLLAIQSVIFGILAPSIADFVTRHPPLPCLCVSPLIISALMLFLFLWQMRMLATEFHLVAKLTRQLWARPPRAPRPPPPSQADTRDPP